MNKPKAKHTSFTPIIKTRSQKTNEDLQKSKLYDNEMYTNTTLNVCHANTQTDKQNPIKLSINERVDLLSKKVDLNEFLQDDEIELYVDNVIKIPSNVLYINGAVTQLLKCEHDIQEICHEMCMDYYEFIIFMVSNSCEGEDPGTHWTLLVYNKNDGIYYHLDSVVGLNFYHAKQIAVKINKYISSDKDPLVIELKCKQQDNGIDCGVFALRNLEILCSLIKYKLIVNNDAYYQEECEVQRYRKTLHLLKIGEYVQVDNNKGSNYDKHLLLNNISQNNTTSQCKPNKMEKDYKVELNTGLINNNLNHCNNKNDSVCNIDRETPLKTTFNDTDNNMWKKVKTLKAKKQYNPYLVNNYKQVIPLSNRFKVLQTEASNARLTNKSVHDNTFKWSNNHFKSVTKTSKKGKKLPKKPAFRQEKSNRIKKNIFKVEMQCDKNNCLHSENKQETTSKILIISDSQGRDLSQFIVPQRNQKPLVISRPGARLKEIITESLEEILKLTKNDFLVIIGGTHDMNDKNLQSIDEALFLLSPMKSRTNIILNSIPFRYDSHAYLNHLINETNKYIFKVITEELQKSNVCFINVNEELNRSDFTKHGLHYNKYGKRKIANLFQKEIKRRKIAHSAAQFHSAVDVSRPHQLSLPPLPLLQHHGLGIQQHQTYAEAVSSSSPPRHAPQAAFVQNQPTSEDPTKNTTFLGGRLPAK